jgi:hypothetical protein
MHINNPQPEGLIIMVSLLISLLLATGAPACEYEDGSSQKVCIWDAKHMGNGEGKSGIIIKGGTDHSKWIPVSHRTAHRIIAAD